MLCYKGIEDTVLWFKKAKPEPTEKDISTQLGVHLEEISELINEIDAQDPNVEILLKDLFNQLLVTSQALKETDKGIHIADRVAVLDALCDQIVTAVGFAACTGMDIENGLNEVNRSNFSKFDNLGNPILDKDRKIIKGPDYTKPNLTNLV